MRSAKSVHLIMMICPPVRFRLSRIAVLMRTSLEPEVVVSSVDGDALRPRGTSEIYNGVADNFLRVPHFNFSSSFQTWGVFRISVKCGRFASAGTTGWHGFSAPFIGITGPIARMNTTSFHQPHGWVREILARPPPWIVARAPDRPTRNGASRRRSTADRNW